MKTFTQWFVINAMVFTASIAGFQQGVFQYMLAHDASYIALICLILYVGFSLYLGKVAYLIDKHPSHTADNVFRLQPAYFMAENFLLLGLLGTTGGLCYTIVKALPLAQGGDTAEFLKQLMNGTGRTLITTIFALICTIILSTQLFVLERKLDSQNH